MSLVPNHESGVIYPTARESLLLTTSGDRCSWASTRSSTDFRHQHRLLLQHGSQTSMWFSVATLIADINMVSRDNMDHRHPNGLRWQHNHKHQHGPQQQDRPWTLTCSQWAVLTMDIHMEAIQSTDINMALFLSTVQ